MSADSKSDQKVNNNKMSSTPKEPYRSPYSALYGGFDESRETFGPVQNTITPQQSYFQNTQTTQSTHPPVQEEPTSTPTPIPPSNSAVKPFTSIFPSVQQMNKSNISAVSSSLPSTQNKSNYSNVNFQLSADDPFEKLKLMKRYSSLVNKNYEILPTEYRQAYQFVKYANGITTLGFFFYFITKFTTSRNLGEGGDFRKMAIRFFLMFMGLTFGFGYMEDSVLKKAFNLKFHNMSNQQIEKSLEEYKETVPLLKL